MIQLLNHSVCNQNCDDNNNNKNGGSGLQSKKEIQMIEFLSII